MPVMSPSLCIGASGIGASGIVASGIVAKPLVYLPPHRDHFPGNGMFNS